MKHFLKKNSSYGFPKRNRIFLVKTNSSVSLVTFFAVSKVAQPDCKNLHWLSERLASLGIMGVQLGDPLNPPDLNTIVQWCTGGLVSRTAMRLITVVFPFLSQSQSPQPDELYSVQLTNKKKLNAYPKYLNFRLVRVERSWILTNLKWE